MDLFLLMCMCLCLWGVVHVCLCLWVCVHVYLCLWRCVHVCLCLWECVHVCLCLWGCVLVYVECWRRPEGVGSLEAGGAGGWEPWDVTGNWIFFLCTAATAVSYCWSVFSVSTLVLLTTDKHSHSKAGGASWHHCVCFWECIMGVFSSAKN